MLGLCSGQSCCWLPKIMLRLQSQVGRLNGWHSRSCAPHQQCGGCAACASGMLTVQQLPMQEPEVLDNIRVLEVARKTKPVKRTKQPAGQVAVKPNVCHYDLRCQLHHLGCCSHMHELDKAAMQTFIMLRQGA